METNVNPSIPEEVKRHFESLCPTCRCGRTIYGCKDGWHDLSVKYYGMYHEEEDGECS